MTTNSDSIQTRPSLLNRLKTGDDTQSWQEFYRTYGGLIRAFARKAGLTEDEAEEVVQETAISVAKHLTGFIYDPTVCAFKTWLLNLTTWRIRDRLRARRKAGNASIIPPGANDQTSPAKHDDDTGLTSTVERVPDPNAQDFGAVWDAAWEKNLFDRALETVKDRIDLKQFQIFDLYVLKEWPAQEVASTMGISAARVYLTKYRVSRLVETEIRTLEQTPKPRR